MNRTRLYDLAERVGWTALQAFLAVWIATEADLWSETSFKVAGTAAVIAAAKCILAFQVGSENTAATLPIGPDSNLGGDRGSVDLNMVAAIVLGIVLAVGVLYVLQLAV